MVHVIEGLADDWRRLDERIEFLSSEIGALACGDSASFASVVIGPQESAGCIKVCVTWPSVPKPIRCGLKVRHRHARADGLGRDAEQSGSMTANAPGKGWTPADAGR
jgi:hypothetical protein